MLEKSAKSNRPEIMCNEEKPKAELREVRRDVVPKDATIRKNECVSNEVYFFDKCDFSKLEVIGQFNNGFILSELRNQKSEYFIIDQHAADERFNLETLVENRKISKQTLLNPIKLDFLNEDVILLPVYSKCLATFGFSIIYDATPKCYHLATIPSDLASIGFEMQGNRCCLIFRFHRGFWFHQIRFLRPTSL